GSRQPALQAHPAHEKAADQVDGVTVNRGPWTSMARMFVIGIVHGGSFLCELVCCRWLIRSLVTVRGRDGDTADSARRAALRIEQLSTSVLASARCPQPR